MAVLIFVAVVSAGLNIGLALSAFWWGRGGSQAARVVFPVLVAFVLLASFTLGASTSPGSPALPKGAASFIAALVLAVPGVLLGIKVSLARSKTLSGLLFPVFMAAALGAAFPLLSLALIAAFTGDAL